MQHGSDILRSDRRFPRFLSFSRCFSHSFNFVSFEIILYYKKHPRGSKVTGSVFQYLDRLVGSIVQPPPPHPLHKVRMRLFKICINVRDGKFLLEIGGDRNRGIGFIMGGCEIFIVSLHIFHEDPPYIAFPLSVVFLLLFFFGWMGTLFDVLFYLMIIWVYTCQALVL